MKRNIPSRVCDRCGEPYKLFEMSKRPVVAFQARLRVLDSDNRIVGSMDVRIPDLCPKCGQEVGEVLQTLQKPREGSPS